MMGWPTRVSRANTGGTSQEWTGGGETSSHDVPWPHVSACHALAKVATIGRHRPKHQVEKSTCRGRQAKDNAGLSLVEIMRRIAWRKAAPNTSTYVTAPRITKGECA